MAMGRVKHKSSKVAKAYYKAGGKGLKVGIEVITNRVGYASSPGKYRGYYAAKACVRRSAKSGVSRCGEIAHGPTPTAAVKKALTSLVKKLK